MDKDALGKKIHQISHIKGEFLLRSGATSKEYFDKYLFEAQPQVLRAIAEHLAPCIPEDTEFLAGLELGGVPIATMLSQMTGIASLFVRKKAKEYGTCKFAEGGDYRGKKVVVVEDVVTSGGQILLSTEDLRREGARIEKVLCVIDRESGGKERLASEGLQLHSLFTKTELESFLETL